MHVVTAVLVAGYLQMSSLEAVMFDLFTGRVRHMPSHAAFPIFLSTSLQASVIVVAALLPMLYVTDHLPEIPTMMAFVAAPPAPPPPPPPAPVAPKPKPAQTEAPARPSENRFLAPVEEPAQIATLREDEGFDAGVTGGVEGGIPGGVIGGVVGGLPEAPPPPPPPQAPKKPVRIGGQIQQPTLVKRIEPDYPAMAVSARIQGIVILEATVGEDGAVTEVRVLRSANALLDREAELAVKQWRYSPLVLNGIRVPFVLTVTLSFFLQATS